MNLLTSAWIPVRRKDGSRDYIAPHQIVEDLDYVDFPRPDFNNSITLFLVGLLQTCFAPESDKAWQNGLKKRPSSLSLKKAFSEHIKLFNIYDENGKHPVFMQEFNGEFQEKNEVNVSDLFLDGTRQKTVEDRKDFFRKHGTINNVCPSCAAALIYTLQTNAFSGGKGYYTCIRGGGTIAMSMIAEGDDLWETLWLNVLPEKEMSQYGTSGELLFPWAVEYRPSATPDNSDPCHIYWEMARRIRLNFRDEKVHCDCCNRVTEIVVSKAYLKSPGTKYSNEWKYPLCPYEGEDKILSYESNFRLSNILKTVFGLGKRVMPVTARQGKSIFVYGPWMSNSKYFALLEKRIPWITPDEKGKSLLEWMLKVQDKFFKQTLGKIHGCWSEGAPLDNPYKSMEGRLETELYRIVLNPSASSKQEWLEALLRTCLKEFDDCYTQTSKVKAYYQRGYLIKTFSELFDKEKLVFPTNLPSVPEKERSFKRDAKLSFEFCSSLMKWWSGYRKFNPDVLMELRDVTVLEEVFKDSFSAAYDGLLERFVEHHQDRVTERVKRLIAIAMVLISHVDEHSKENFRASLSRLSPTLGRRVFQIRDIFREWDVIVSAISQMPRVNVISLFEYVISK